MSAAKNENTQSSNTIEGPLVSSVVLQSALEEDDAGIGLQNKVGAIFPAIIVAKIHNGEELRNTHQGPRRYESRDSSRGRR